MTTLILTSFLINNSFASSLLYRNNGAVTLSGDSTKKPQPGYGKVYNARYSLHPGYTPAGKLALVKSDSVRNATIIADMSNDNLINTIGPLAFILNNNHFIINGEEQNEETFQRYKKKYVPELKEGDEWEWSYHGSNDK